MSSRRRRALALLVVLLALAACAPESGSGEPPAVVLNDSSCDRSGTDSLVAGDVSIAVRNDSGSVGNFELLELAGSYLDVSAYVAQEQARIAAGELPQGLPETVRRVDRISLGPMESGALEANAPPGLYAVLCARLTSSQGSVLSIHSVGPYEVNE